MKNKIKRLTGFVLVIFSYFITKGIYRVTFKRIHLPVWFDSPKSRTVSKVDLIELSLQNLKAKKNRTWITIGGMTIGIAAIVFLVSLGYGVQKLVVTKVARLEEMQQADVAPPSGGKVKINDSTISSIEGLSNIKMVLPLISVVGRVSYQNSVSDVAVYGVTADYLQQSAIKPSFGKVFESNNISLVVSQGEVAGVTTEDKIKVAAGEKTGAAEYEIGEGNWVRVRAKPDPKSELIGYTKRVEGQTDGDEYWGGSYISSDGAGSAGMDETGKTLGKWIESEVLIWEAMNCDIQNSDCAEGKYLVKRDNSGSQIQELGYMAEIGMKVNQREIIKTEKILGVTDSVGGGSLPQVEIASESAKEAIMETKTVSLSSEAKMEAVVNTALLNVLGIKENEAVGKKFETTFVVVGNLLSEGEDKVESVPTDYTIVGVIPGDKNPMFYVPFIDLRSLGVVNYSQIKMVVKNSNELNPARRQVEAMGYLTRSVADTVEQINNLFTTARTILALLGFMALAVASLGMFNTLTVSLMERVREVGLMKAMGMKSPEIQELFLSESLIMGLGGGIFGLILGFILGKLLGLGLSIFSLIKGMGMVDVSYIPFPFVLVVIGLSLLIGIITGFYPARRATKISALNALRYE